MSTKSERRRSLDTLPKGLFSAFEETIERIRDQGDPQSKHAMAVLLWVSHAQRPMTVEELQHALAVREGEEFFDFDNVLTVDKILGCCLGLVIIDQQTRSVRLVHYSLKEYFDSVQQQLFPNGHAQLEKTCLTYLLFPEFELEDITSRYSGQSLQLRKQFHFLEYAAYHWPSHAGNHADDTVIPFEIRLLSKPATHCAFQAYTWNAGVRGRFLEGGNGCHLATYLRIERIFKAAFTMENSVNINAGAARGRLPIHIAILNRDMQSGGDVSISEAPETSSSPGSLQGAVAPRMTYTEVFVAILRHPATNLSAAETCEGTCLHTAILEHHHDFARMLLDDNRISINKVNDQGRTALHLAVLEFMRLDHVVLNDRLESTGLTAETRNDQANEDLLERILANPATDVMIPDRTGASALHYLLLRSGCVRRKLLPAFLGHSSFDISKDTRLPRILSAAIMIQDEWAVENLLSIPEMDPNIPDIYPYTACKFFVNDSLFREGLDMPDRNEYYYSKGTLQHLRHKRFPPLPLFRALLHSDQTITHRLLEDPRLQMSDYNWFLAIQLLALRENLAPSILPRMIARGALVNYAVNDGLTHLHMIALDSKPRTMLCYTLLQHGADVNARTRLGETPLDLATYPFIIELFNKYGSGTKGPTES